MEGVTVVKKRAARQPRQSSTPSQRDYWKVRQLYLDTVRNHDESELLGVLRQIRKLVEKDGIALGVVIQAIQNYASSEFVRSQPEPERLHIRRFFMPVRISQWAQLTRVNASTLGGMALLVKQQELAAQAPAIPTWKPEADDEDDACIPEL